MRRLVIAAAVGAAVVATAVPSLASSTPKQSIPIGVSNNNGKVCVWFSEQVPQCVNTAPVTDAIPGTFNIGPVQVTVSTNGGVFVGSSLGSQPLVGAYVANGQACVGFSLETPVCAPVRAVG